MNVNALKLIKNIWTLPSRKGMYFVALLITVGASTALALLTSHNELARPQSVAQDTLVVSRLDELQSQLKTVKETVSKPTPEVNLKAITHQIEELSQRVEHVREANNKQLNDSLTDTQRALGEELHSIKEVVTHLDDKKSPIKYLSIKSLPFSIISIDSIQQVPVASVSYDYKTIPLEKGDALAGWRVVRVDYGTQKIELENTNAERILVTHEHIG